MKPLKLARKNCNKYRVGPIKMHNQPINAIFSSLKILNRISVLQFMRDWDMFFFLYPYVIGLPLSNI